MFSRLMSLCFISLLITACSSGSSDDDKSTSQGGDIFSEDKILIYKVQMLETDWQAMAGQGKNLGVIAGACNQFTGYNFYRASVIADGQRFDDVEIRKKGALGSLSTVRPSIKLDMGSGELNLGRTFRTHRRLTLNNNRQDASNLEQCLAYELFNQAGIKAPLCNLARVFSLGNDLGIYTHVENIKKPFLKRVFNEESGNLYEGDNADFNTGIVSRFQKKTNELLNDRSDLDQVIAALAVPDDQLWNALDQVINMDYFLTFMAMEALIGHSDSYSGSQSNFYIYKKSIDQRFYFIPWGADQSFQEKHVSRSTIDNHSVLLRSELSSRIWQVPALREAYDSRIQLLLNTIWNESSLLDWVSQWAILAKTPQEYLTPLQSFINNRRSQIEAELGDDSRTSSGSPRDSIPTSDGPNCKTLDDFTGNFDGTWNSFDDSDTSANFDFQYRLDGMDINLISLPGTSLSGTNAGVDTTHNDSDFDRGSLSFWKKVDDITYWMTLVFPPSLYKTGTHALHGFESFAVIGNTEEGFQGFVGDGSFTLNQAQESGDLQFSGTINGKVIP